MHITIRLSVLVIGLSIGSIAGVSAKEINKRTHLDPGSQAKVNSVIAGSRKKQDFDSKKFGRITNEGCSDLIVGPTESNSRRQSREVIIVARDIINVNRNC